MNVRVEWTVTREHECRESRRLIGKVSMSSSGPKQSLETSQMVMHWLSYAKRGSNQFTACFSPLEKREKSRLRSAE